MNEHALTIILGVPSGIFTALFIWLFFIFYEKQLKPWFQDILYKGVEVQGLWQSNCEISHNVGNDEPIATHTLNISKQQGHVIKGTFSQHFISSDLDRYGSFKAEGYVIDGVIILTLMPENRSKSTFGTVVLNIGSASSALEGMFTYKGAITNRVKSQNVNLVKKN